MTSSTLTNRAWLLLGLLGLIWGGSFLSIRIALDEIAPLTSVFHRVFWAAVLLWAYILLRRFALPRGWRIWGAFLVMGLLNNVIPFGLMAWGQLHIESGLTSIFNAATAIWGVLVAAVIFADERLSLGKLVGVVMGVAGVATAVGLSNLMTFDLRSLAQLAVLAGTLSYAFASAWARARLTGLRPEVAAAGMLTGALVLIAPLTFAVDGLPSLALAPITWAAIGYYALIATALAYLLYYQALALAGAGNLMLVTLLIPPVAITLGAIVRDETLAPNAYLGFGLLALGLVLIDGRVFRPRAG